MQAISESIYSVYYILRFNRPINWFELGPHILSTLQTGIPFPPFYDRILPNAFYCNSKKTQLFLISFTNHRIHPDFASMPEELKEAYDEWVPYNYDIVKNEHKNFMGMYKELVGLSLIEPYVSLTEDDFYDDLLEMCKHIMYFPSKKMDEKINKSNVFTLSEQEKEIKTFIEEWTKSQPDLSIVYDGWMESNRIECYDRFEETTEELKTKFDIVHHKCTTIRDIYGKLCAEEELKELEKIEEELRIKKAELSKKNINQKI